MKPELTKPREEFRFEVLKNVSLDFMNYYKDHKVDEMLKLCTPDAEVYFKPLKKNGLGNVHEIGKDIWESLIECFPNISNKILGFEPFGNSQIIASVSISGTQNQDFAGIKTKGNTFDSGHIFVFKVNDDNLIEKIEIDWNHDDFVDQLKK